MAIIIDNYYKALAIHKAILESKFAVSPENGHFVFFRRQRLTLEKGIAILRNVEENR